MSESKLFSTYQLKDITLKNRVVMAPMTRSRSIGNVPNEMVAKYYAQRSGAGLIISEGTSPSVNGVGYPRIPGIYSEAQVSQWKKVTEAVHKNDGKIFIQLMHTGRVGHILNLPEGAEVVAPTKQVMSGEMYTDEEGQQPHSKPRLMTQEDIARAKEEYVQAAKNAMAAGFDGVEIHAANGYLIEQFLNPKVNELDNEYGGSVENRCRFALEVAQGVKEVIGAGKTGIRISPYGVFNDMALYEGVEETYSYLTEGLGKLGIAYVHLVDHSSMGTPEVPVSIKKLIRDKFNATVIISGGYDRDKAGHDLERGLGDLVAFGRPFISNPDLVERLKSGEGLAGYDMDTFYTPGEKGYTDYPELQVS